MLPTRASSGTATGRAPARYRVVKVPYHIDDYLPQLDLPLQAGQVITVDTPSGYLGGLPLRLLVGYRPELIAARLGLRPVPEGHVLGAGARDLDPPEVTYLAKARIRRSEATNLDAALLPGGPLYVHLDLDVIDPGELPGLRYPAPGGPPSGQVVGTLRRLLGTGRVAAVGIACTWHPGHAAAGRIDPYLQAALAPGLGQVPGQ